MHLSDRQVFGSNAHNSHIHLRIRPDQPGIQLASIGQSHANPACVSNYMRIGKDLPIGSKNETGAKSTAGIRAAKVAISPASAIDIDTYHRRTHTFRRSNNRVRVGIYSLCILFVYAHSPTKHFLWNPPTGLRVRGSTP